MNYAVQDGTDKPYANFTSARSIWVVEPRTEPGTEPEPYPTGVHVPDRIHRAMTCFTSPMRTHFGSVYIGSIH